MKQLITIIALVTVACTSGCGAMAQRYYFDLGGTIVDQRGTETDAFLCSETTPDQFCYPARRLFQDDGTPYPTVEDRVESDVCACPEDERVPVIDCKTEAQALQDKGYSCWMMTKETDRNGVDEWENGCACHKPFSYFADTRGEQ